MTISLTEFPALASVNITGDLIVGPNTVIKYEISNYDVFSTYTLTAISGTVTRSGSTISYTSPGSIGSGGFILNDKTFIISVQALTVNTPLITSPITGVIGQNPSVTITSSAFASSGNDTHLSSSWQISTANTFVSIFAESADDTSNLLSWIYPSLNAATTYYLRVRHKGTLYGYSSWSATITIATLVSYLPRTENNRLTPLDRTIGDYYGAAMAINSDMSRAVIGSPRKVSGTILACGQVYHMTRSGSVWTQETVLTAIDKAVNDNYGCSISLTSDGLRMAVGANGRSSGGTTTSGAVYHYTRSGTTWTLESTLVASDKAIGDGFGTSVSLSADGLRMAVGAAYRDSGAIIDSGAVYHYTRAGSVWTLESTMIASDKVTNDWFGSAVALSGDGLRLAVGASRRSFNSIPNCGAVYHYTRSGSVWTQESILTASDYARNDYFGSSVSLSTTGNLMSVGAYGKTTGSMLAGGKVYNLTRTGFIWTLQSAITASDVTRDDLFGSALALTPDGTKLAVGAMGRDSYAINNSGAVYTFI
jgi:hypothetical protein